MSTARTSRPNGHDRRKITATMLALAARLGHSDASPFTGQDGTYVDCAACGNECPLDCAASDNRRFELGHILADCAGGLWSIRNLVPVCRQCNVDIGANDMRQIMTLRYDTTAHFDSELGGQLLADPGPPKQVEVTREWLPVGYGTSSAWFMAS